MPRSPSINVIALLHDAVFMNAGSYASKPKSSSASLILRRSPALIAEPYFSYVPCMIGSSYCRPVRLSVIVSVFAISAPPAPLCYGIDSACVAIYVQGVRPRRNTPCTDIADRFSIVEVADDVAAGVIDALRDSKLKGRKVTVRRDRTGER